MDRFFSATMIIMVSVASVLAQGEEQEKLIINYSAYMDIYYIQSFNKLPGSTRLPYIYHYNRKNELNLNHGYLKLSFEHPKYRANFALQTGTYVMDNYSSEPDYLKAIFDANVGFSLNQANSLWLDLGIFGNSHIGSESTEGWSNWTMSRTILSENVPYFQSGAILSYSPQNWFLSLLFLNGWQRIQKVQGNSLPSFGTQATYTGIDNFRVNWSAYFGTEFPDNMRRMRYFSHFNAVWQLSEQVGITLGWDHGLEQQFTGSSDFYYWNGYLIVIRYSINEKWRTAFRYEHYNDPNSVVVTAPFVPGYQTSGLSSNIDFQIFPNILWRGELRYFFSPDNIYEDDNNLVGSEFSLGTSILVKINSE